VKRALVTGASGFVGRAATSALAAGGYEVHAVSRDRRGGAHWHSADLLEPHAAEALMRATRPTHLLHLAWTTEHGRYWEDPANLAWVEASRRLVDAFSEAGGERAVLAGTCAQRAWPNTLYARAKNEASGFFAATGLLLFPYGPYERPERLVPSVTLSLLAGEEARTTPGKQVRDFVHVADCGKALAALLDSGVQGDVEIGTGRGTAVAEIARAIGRLLGREELLRVGALPGGDESRVVADAARLRDEVGVTPRYELEEGLRDAVEWWRQRTRRK
jgi:nucleoside-diphosphate-sugar epimerase